MAGAGVMYRVKLAGKGKGIVIEWSWGSIPAGPWTSASLDICTRLGAFFPHQTLLYIHTWHFSKASLPQPDETKHYDNDAQTLFNFCCLFSTHTHWPLIQPSLPLAPSTPSNFHHNWVLRKLGKPVVCRVRGGVPIHFLIRSTMMPKPRKKLDKHLGCQEGGWFDKPERHCFWQQQAGVWCNPDSARWPLALEIKNIKPREATWYISIHKMIYFYALLDSWARGLLRHRARRALISLRTYCAQERHAKVEASGSKAGRHKCSSLVNAWSVCFSFGISFDCRLSSFPWLETFWNCWFPTDACDSLRAQNFRRRLWWISTRRGTAGTFSWYWQNHLFLLIADFRVLATLPNLIQDAETIETDWLILYTADKVILKQSINLLIK